MTVYWPNGELTRPRVSSDYDAARRNPVTGIVQPHNGIDLVGWTDNCSPVDGTVVFAGYNGAAGNEVRIRADGPTAFHVGDYYRILHNARLYVSTGQRVSARQPVGLMGTTGQSTGVHCHFETHEWRLWNPVNPTNYMNRANAGSTAAAGPAGTGSRPLNPQEDTMYRDDPDLRARLDQIVDYLSQNFTGLTNVVTAEGGTTREFVDRRVSDLAGWTRDDATAIRAALDGLDVVGTDPRAIAEAIGEAVADVLVRRLAG